MGYIQDEDLEVENGDEGDLSDLEKSSNFNYESDRFNMMKKINKLKKKAPREGEVIGCIQFYFELKNNS